jgi:hypothetical protein
LSSLDGLDESAETGKARATNANALRQRLRVIIMTSCPGLEGPEYLETI